MEECQASQSIFLKISGQLNALGGDTNFPLHVYTSSRIPGCRSNWQGRQSLSDSRANYALMVSCSWLTLDYMDFLVLMFNLSFLLIHTIWMKRNQKYVNTWDYGVIKYDFKKWPYIWNSFSQSYSWNIFTTVSKGILYCMVSTYWLAIFFNVIFLLSHIH